MKILATTFLGLLLSMSAWGQTESEAVAFQHFAMIYTTGSGWDTTKTVNKQAYFAEHSRHLQRLRKEDKIVIGGRYSDKGFMILKAKDLSEAQSIVASDTSVIHKTFQVELFPFSPFYKGCIE